MISRKRARSCGVAGRTISSSDDLRVPLREKKRRPTRVPTGVPRTRLGGGAAATFSDTWPSNHERAGHTVRVALSAQAAHLRADCHRHADARYRREHGDLQPAVPDAAASAALSEAERLVFVWNTYPLMGLSKASVSIPDYIDRKTQAPALEDGALVTDRTLNLVAGGQAEQVNGLAVTPSF